MRQMSPESRNTEQPIPKSDTKESKNAYDDLGISDEEESGDHNLQQMSKNHIEMHPN